MPVYTVFAPPQTSGAAAPDPLRFVFVKDGFCWPALFIPELWLIFRRLWLVLIVYAAISIVVSIVGARIGGPLPWVTLALMHLLLALEGNALRRWKLSARGYQFIGVAEGPLEVAELRFFSTWQPPTPAEAPTAAAPPPPASPAEDARPLPPRIDMPSAESGQVIGLFPSPGGTT
jgi:hypothetical protein